MRFMTKHSSSRSRKLTAFCGLLLFLDAPRFLMGEAPPAAVAAFNSYSARVESRLAQQHRSPGSFLAPAAFDSEAAQSRLRQGELIIERLTPSNSPGITGALLHHWRGTAFAPGATSADFERLMRDFNSYPQHFAPQVVQARVITARGDRTEAWMRVRQRHVIPVVLDTTYDVTFGRLDAQHGYSISRSLRIAEISSAGTSAERALSASEEHGFLWRLNIYWSYEERDDGLYLQMEAVSLTNSIPRGLGWAIAPYVNSIPRESLEFTLRSACNALQKGHTHE
jgi:hypothetical protein